MLSCFIIAGALGGGGRCVSGDLKGTLCSCSGALLLLAGTPQPLLPKLVAQPKFLKFVRRHCGGGQWGQEVIFWGGKGGVAGAASPWPVHGEAAECAVGSLVLLLLRFPAGDQAVLLLLLLNRGASSSPSPDGRVTWSGTGCAYCCAALLLCSAYCEAAERTAAFHLLQGMPR